MRVAAVLAYCVLSASLWSMFPQVSPAAGAESISRINHQSIIFGGQLRMRAAQIALFTNVAVVSICGYLSEEFSTMYDIAEKLGASEQCTRNIMERDCSGSLGNSFVVVHAHCRTQILQKPDFKVLYSLPDTVSGLLSSKLKFMSAG